LSTIIHLPKSARYTLGTRIENRFLDLLELSYNTYFTERDKKAAKIAECIILLDTIKFLITTAWEGKLISHGYYEELALKLEEIGKMLGGWQRSLNNPDKKNRDFS